MSQRPIEGVLLDIEGTVSPLAFVRDVMFPLVRERLDAFLAAHFDHPEVRQAADEIADEEGFDNFTAFLTRHDPELFASTSDINTPASATAMRLLAQAVHRQMDRDAKATGLKRLQGLIWREAFADGTLQASLYPDVRPVLEAWQAAGLDLRIYSSGSQAAQILFFGHTTDGDLTGLFSAFHDTTIGNKREPDSYRRILEDWGLPAESVLFLSDLPAELEAAQIAGLTVLLVERPGNALVPAELPFPSVRSFQEIELGILFGRTSP